MLLPESETCSLTYNQELTNDVLSYIIVYRLHRVNETFDWKLLWFRDCEGGLYQSRIFSLLLLSLLVFVHNLFYFFRFLSFVGFFEKFNHSRKTLRQCNKNIWGGPLWQRNFCQISHRRECGEQRISNLSQKRWVTFSARFA